MKGFPLDIPLRGMDQQLYPQLGAAVEVVNMVRDAGAWRPAPGTSLVVESEAKIVSMGWYSTHNGIGQLIVEYGVPGTPGSLGYVHWPTGTIVPFADDRRIMDVPGARSTHIQFGNWHYVFSPHNAPVRWNGRRKMAVGFDRAPPPPTVSALGGYLVDQAYGVPIFTASAGTSNEHQRGVGIREEATITAKVAWKYAYRISWLNDLGMESPPSAIAWLEYEQLAPVATEDFVRKVSVMLQAQGAPANVWAVRVWRSVDSYLLPTDGTEPPCYLLAEISPLDASLWIDDHADSELGILLDPTFTGVVPPRVRCVASFAGRSWVGTSTSDRLYYSAPLFVEQFPENNWLPVAGSGPVITVKAARNALIVYKERSISIVTETQTGEYQITTLTEQSGASCPVVIEVPGMGQLSLSDQGPFLLTGSLEAGVPTTAKYIGDQIADTWERVNRSALISAVGSIHRRKREVWFQVPSTGSNEPDLGLVFHYPSGFWSIREGYIAVAVPGGPQNIPPAILFTPVTAMVETGDARADLFLAGQDGIHHVSQGYVQDREVRYTLGPIDLSQRSTLMHAELLVQGEGRHSITVAAFVNRSPIPVTAAEERWTLDPERGRPTYEGPPLWGTALWSTTETWDAVVPVRVRFDPWRQSALEHTLEISGERLTLAGVRAIVQQSPTEQPMAGVKP
jgi:hypothetical protein